MAPGTIGDLAKAVAARIADASRAGRIPAIVTVAAHRRFLSAALEAKGVRAPVVSYEEISPRIRPMVVGVA